MTIPARTIEDLGGWDDPLQWLLIYDEYEIPIKMTSQYNSRVWSARLSEGTIQSVQVRGEVTLIMSKSRGRGNKVSPQFTHQGCMIYNDDEKTTSQYESLSKGTVLRRKYNSICSGEGEVTLIMRKSRREAIKYQHCLLTKDVGCTTTMRRRLPNI